MIDYARKKNKVNKKKKQKKSPREVLLYHFGLHKDTSHVGICHCISEKMGIPVPGEKKLYKKVMKKAAGIIMNSINTAPAKTRRATPAVKFFASKEWKELRYLALKQSGGACQLCGARAGDGVQIHIDHIKPRSKFPELEYDLDNLQTLCSDCNVGKSNIDDTDWRQHWESL